MGRSFRGGARLILARLLLPALVAALAACSSQSEVCWVCQREITPNVRVTLSLDEGRKVHACCPRCALHYQSEGDRTVRHIAVSDHATGGSLSLESAYFVEGSDETPCLKHHHAMTGDGGAPMQVCYDRCMPSLIAFARRDAAQAFLEEHGGALIPPGGLAGRTPPAP